jgi:hypothetical protein
VFLSSHPIARHHGLITSGTALAAVLLLLSIFFAQGFAFIHANSPTYDEAKNLTAGYSHLVKKDFRLAPESPPLLKELFALPLFVRYRPPFNPDPEHWRAGADYLIGQDFLYGAVIPADQMLALGRLPNLFLGTCLIVVIGWWSYRLWGNRAALLGVALGSFEPNLVAHSSLVTTDMGFTLFMFLTVYLLWEYFNFPSLWLLAVIGFSTGMALISKFSAILVIPMIAVIFAASLLIESKPPLLPLRNNQQQLAHKLLQSATIFCFMLIFTMMLIIAAHFFQGFEAWFFGLQRFLTLAQQGQPAFFLGQYSYRGWWNYFAVAFLIKSSIGSLILIVASLALWRAGAPIGRRAIVFLVLPVILIFLAMSHGNVNIGVRHILPVYPFLFVLASRVATVQFRRYWFAPLLIGTPLVWTAISSLRVAPHQLAYFNELVGGPAQGHRYLSDSNVDWGQDLKGVKAYMEKEKLPIIYLSYFGTAPPSYYGIRYQYVPGTWPLAWPPPRDTIPNTSSRKILAISVTNLQDVANPDDPLFRWLWTRMPIAKIGFSIFVYDLTNDREGLTKLEETYAKVGIKPPS